MNPCTCDIPNCDGILCYFATPTDDEAIEPRATVYTPSADYLEWLASLEPRSELKRTGTGGWL